jgi:hypothetical protein
LFQNLLATATQKARPGLQEFKGSDLYRGRGKWGKVESEQRVQLLEQIVGFAADRKHRLVLGAVDINRFDKSQIDCPPSGDARMIAALHCVLQVERHQRSKKGNKGDTLFLFDEHRGNDVMAEYLLDAPIDVRSYFGEKGRPANDSCIVEAPLSVRSERFGMIQIADVLAFLFRRFAEVEAGQEEWFVGEKERLREWAKRLSERLVPRPDRWPSRNAGPLPQQFRNLCPPSLRFAPL